MPLVQIGFEVFGKVQAVFFRKHTQEECKKLGLRGWCRNTGGGTVLGEIEGEKIKVEKMKMWLQHVGSPRSRIEKVIFGEETTIKGFHYQGFTIIR